MTVRLILTFIILQTFVINNAVGQERNTTRSNQQWLQYYNQTKLNEAYSLLVDGGLRRRSNSTYKSQYIIRGAIRKKINKQFNLALGAAHLGTYDKEGIQKTEFRPYQEANLTQSLGKVSVKHRYRVEERFFKTLSNPNTKAFNLRFRYLLGFKIPLFAISKTHTKQKVTFNIGDEILVNAGNQIEHRFFDQNRLLIGTAVPINKNLTFSLTYDGLFASTSTESQFKFSNILWLGIKHFVDFS